MTTYYVGAEETGGIRGLFSRTTYFALFNQPYRLGEGRYYHEEWRKGLLGRPEEILARINARSIDELAEGLMLHAGATEEFCTRRKHEQGEFVILDKEGNESYLSREDIKEFKRHGSQVIAVTSDGEKRCKTYVSYNKGETTLIIRLYGQIPTESYKYHEIPIIDAWQFNNPWSRDLMRNIETHFVRELSLREQRSLSREVKGVMKRRARREEKYESSYKLVERGYYPDGYEVFRKGKSLD
ncbi:MAG: hypothetical protein WCV90_04225 [Candidatus Woesearchaeota archaeon]|jgi:hypothetical protein